MEAALVPSRPHTRVFTRQGLRHLAGWSALGLIVAVWIFFLRPESLGGTAAYLIVSGHSMEPTLHSGDLVVAFRQRAYGRGDVIAYHIPKNQAGAGALVIHRIVGGSAGSGYITRGDNRAYKDPWRPKANDIGGEMKVHAPRLGMLPVYAHTVFGMALIAAFAGFLVLNGGERRPGGTSAPRLEGPEDGRSKESWAVRVEHWGEAEWTARDLR
jgi:signal peptidase